MICTLRTAALASMLLLLVQTASAAEVLMHEFPPGLIVPPAAQMSPDFDVDKATQAKMEADIFGLNAAREPQGFAMAAMRLSSYRKMRPNALEEMVFFDHPSGYTRVYDSMRWLKENPSAAEKP